MGKYHKGKRPLKIGDTIRSLRYPKGYELFGPDDHFTIKYGKDYKIEFIDCEFFYVINEKGVLQQFPRKNLIFEEL